VQPGINIDFTNRLDSDLSQKRTLIANTSLYFDPMFSPNGTVSYSATLSDIDKKKIKLCANFVNRMILSELSFKPIKQMNLNFSFMLPPDIETIPMAQNITDEYTGTLVFKGIDYSISSHVSYKPNIASLKTSLMKTLMSGIHFGTEYSINYTGKFLNNILLLVCFHKYKFSDTFQIHGNNKELSMSYMKNIKKEKKLATKITYNLKNKDSFWCVGYNYFFTESAARISTSINSKMKLSTMFSSRISNLPVNITFGFEMDHLKGQHKLGFIFQAVSNSKEEMEDSTGMI